MEILAPAGNKQNLIQAVSSGANAVYLGLKTFSARSSADNFSIEELKYIVAYAKTFGVKVYVTVNTLIKNDELSDFFNQIKVAYELGVDAFILQDIFLGKYLKSVLPEITLHLSTQAGVSNVYGAQMAKEYGFSRVILARETTLDDIKEISKIIETEVFVQGALCTSMSGHCYFSSFVGGNSGNRGACKQPCRKLYSYINNGETVKKGFCLSLSDLCVGEKLSILKDLGVKSIKIEGRMRSEEYVAVSVQYYKSILNRKSRPDLFKALKSVYNRGDYTEGLCFGQKNYISDKIQSHKGLKVGVVDKIIGDKLYFKDYYNYEIGDSFKIVRNGREIGSATCLSENGKPTVKFKGNILPGDEINVTKDVSVINKYLSKPLTKNITVDVIAKVGEKLTLSALGVTVESDGVLDVAKSRPVTKEDIISNLNKTDVYPFTVTANVVLEGQPFIVNSLLNGLRSKLYSEIFYRNLHKKCDIIFNINDFCNAKSSANTNMLCVITDKDFIVPNNVTDVVVCPSNYNNVENFNNVLNSNKKVWLYIPPYVSSNDLQIIDKVVDKFYGIFGEGYWCLQYAKTKKVKLFAGLGFNVFNDVDVYYLNNEGVQNISLSKELKASEIYKFNSDNFVLTRGAIELMDLIYCPFDKSCKNCKISNELTLQDTEKRNFSVLRYVLDGCRFKIFNCSTLLYDIKNFNQIYDLRTLTTSERNDILSNLTLTELKNKISNHTNGNFIKGTV